MITAVILFSLLALVIYFYVADTARRFMQSMAATGRMALVVLMVILILIIMIYTLLKFGTVI